MQTVSVILLSFSLLYVSRPSSIEEVRKVRCDIHLSSATLKPGAAGEIVLIFAPDEGIHINTDPPMEFEFEKSSFVHFKGITSLPKAATTGYLDTKKPVTYSFTLDKKIQKGKHTLKGSVHYFFCSDAEGWCNRFVQPIELTFTVTH